MVIRDAKITLVGFVFIFLNLETQVEASTCGPIALQKLKKLAQENHVSAASIGEIMVQKCPKERTEALQWTSFALSIQGQKDRSRTVDRLLIPKPKASGVMRTLQMAEAGSYQRLQNRMENFHPSYKNNPKYRLVLGRALARSGDFDLAKKEIFTYLAKFPNDSIARIEFLYLDIWAEKSLEALKSLDLALQESSQPETKLQIQRGIDLVNQKWPVERQSHFNPPFPPPNQESSPPPLKKEVEESSMAKDSTAPLKNTDVYVQGFLMWKKNFFQTRGATIFTESRVVNPKVLFFETSNTALSEPKFQNFSLNISNSTNLAESLKLNSSLGWYSVGESSLFLGSAGFSFLEVSSELKLTFEVARRALGMEEVTLKQDAVVLREQLQSTIGWKDMVSWNAKLWKDQGVLTAEQHELLARWNLVDCEVKQCVQLNLPLDIYRYRVVSPYFYSDIERQGYGLGFVASHVFGFVELGGAGNWKQWSAVLPSNYDESYATSELTLSSRVFRGLDYLGLEYTVRQTTSKFLFRSREVPSDFSLNIKAQF